MRGVIQPAGEKDGNPVLGESESEFFQVFHSDHRPSAQSDIMNHADPIDTPEELYR